MEWQTRVQVMWLSLSEPFVVGLQMFVTRLRHAQARTRVLQTQRDHRPLCAEVLQASVMLWNFALDQQMHALPMPRTPRLQFVVELQEFVMLWSFVPVLLTPVQVI